MTITIFKDGRVFHIWTGFNSEKQQTNLVNNVSQLLTVGEYVLSVGVPTQLEKLIPGTTEIKRSQ